MRKIENFDQVQAAYGRNGGRLKAGTYIIRIDGVSEDQTNYGNDCLKLVYNIAEGEFAGFFDDIAGQPDMDWRHTIEVDVEDGNGKWLKGLIDAVAASNPGFVWNWDENALIGRFVGVTFQERQTTAKRGKRKGRMQSYLDLWGFVSVEQVRSGDYDTPAINDKRDYEAEAKAAALDQQQQTPVSVPSSIAQGMAPQAPSTNAPQNAVPQAPTTVPPTSMTQQVPAAPQTAPQQGYPQQGYQQQVPQQQGYQQMPPVSQQNPDMYAQDIPF